MSPLPPSRVMKLIELVSLWANVNYGGCRYLRETRLETLRKYSVLHEYFKDVNQPSIFYRVLNQEEEDYVLMGLSREDCTPLSNAVYDTVPICSWSQYPVAEFQCRSLMYTSPRQHGLAGLGTTIKDSMRWFWSGF